MYETIKLDEEAICNWLHYLFAHSIYLFLHRMYKLWEVWQNYDENCSEIDLTFKDVSVGGKITVLGFLW